MRRILAVSLMLAGLYVVVKPEELSRAKKWIEGLSDRFMEAWEVGKEAAVSKEKEISHKMEH